MYPISNANETVSHADKLLARVYSRPRLSEGWLRCAWLSVKRNAVVIVQPHNCKIGVYFGNTGGGKPRDRLIGALEQNGVASQSQVCKFWLAYCELTPLAGNTDSAARLSRTSSSIILLTTSGSVINLPFWVKRLWVKNTSVYLQGKIPLISAQRWERSSW
jgi:hypothetical protein